jgi:hypothetical protein
MSMGRWGDGIYESDAALDYFSKITDFIDREMLILYLVAPEVDSYQGDWIAQMLAVIEAMLLFEKHNIGSSIYLNETDTIERWREVFLRIWDGDWHGEGTRTHPVDNAEYRKEQRSQIIEMFDYLKKIAVYWNSEKPEVKPVPADYQLPLLSVHRWKTEEGREVIKVKDFAEDFIAFLEKEIIYRFSQEKRGEAVTFFSVIEEVWVAVDILGLLCETYEQSPGVSAKIVQMWRETFIRIWEEWAEAKVEEDDTLFKNGMAVFDRLEAVARKYPAYEW